MSQVNPVAAATYFVQTIGCTAFPVWGSDGGRCHCGDPHDGTKKHGPDNAGKHPATPNGFKDATSNLQHIKTFLQNPGTPNYGLNAPEGVLVIDVDGADGLASWDQLQHRYGPLPITLTTTTANGRHYFYRWPTSSGPMPTGKLFGFVVRRHDDGYVIGPGSVHPSGVVYDTLRQPNGMPYAIADLPDSWATAALEAKPVMLTVAGRLPQVGERHDWLRNTARLYAGTVRDPDALKAAIMAENRKLPEPKSEAEVDRAIGAVLQRFGPDPVETDPETGETRRVHADELGMLRAPTVGEFPEPPDAAAYDGLLGECAIALSDGTDASMVGLLGSLIAFCGALVPGLAYFHRLHSSSPFIALVGQSSIGRKGTAMMRAHDAVADTFDPVSVNRVILDGLNSGEGLVSALAYKKEAYSSEPTVGLVFEEEYATLLAARGRDGSTLDPKMRAAFDGSQLSNRRSQESKTVAMPYWLPALIAITPTELRRRLEPGALESGSANRWLYLPVTRREIMPTNDEPRLPDAYKEQLKAARRKAMSGTTLVLGVHPDVTATLSEYADFLPDVSPGISGELVRRMQVIAFRVALVHALVEGAASVTPQHLGRALALTEYARRGIAWVFGGTVGNRDADLLLRHLQDNGTLRQGTISRSIIRDPIRRQDAIDELVRLGYAQVTFVHETGGRPRSELRAVPFAGTFARFARYFLYPSQQESAASVERMDETAWEGARKVRESRAEGAQNGADNQPTVTCQDFPAHQTRHLRRKDGSYYCPVCYPNLQAVQ